MLTTIEEGDLLSNRKLYEKSFAEDYERLESFERSLVGITVSFAEDFSGNYLAEEHNDQLSLFVDDQGCCGYQLSELLQKLRNTSVSATIVEHLFQLEMSENEWK